MASNESKLTEFIKDRKGALLHFIRSRIAGNGIRDAEDLLHDAVAGVLSSGELEAVGEISGYLFRSIRNRIIDLYRKGDREHSLDSIEEVTADRSDLLSDKSPSLHEELERAELRDAIFNAIDSLSSHERAVWIATELEGATYAELASQWNEPIGTLLSRKSRATKKLQVLLQEYRINNSEIG
jgi:RNA polymerase sigma factor (sigma-70 family)